MFRTRLLEKGPKNIERESRKGFCVICSLFCWGVRHAEHLLLRSLLEGRGPNLVSNVSVSYEAVREKERKKHNARAPSPVKSDDLHSKNARFGILPRIHWDPLDFPGTVSATAAPTLPNTRAGGQDDGIYTNSLKLVRSSNSEVEKIPLPLSPRANPTMKELSPAKGATANYVCPAIYWSLASPMHRYN